MPARAAGDDADARAALFAFLLAAALLLHVLWWHGPEVRSPWAAVAAAAAWLTARPSSVGRLALLLAAASVAIVLELPALGSHLLLVLATAACVLVHLASGAARARRGPDAGPARATRLPTAGELWPRLVPFLRAAVVVLYAAAVLAKLNDAYLDPATSPAGPLAGRVAWFAPVAFHGDWRAGTAVWASLLVEAALPVLLLRSRTRRAGLALGLAFHGVLAASGTVPFTALMLALYVAFLPTGAGPARDAVRAARAARGLPVGAAAVVVLWGAAALAGLDPGRVDGGVLATLTRLLVLTATVAALTMVVGRGRAVPARPRASAGGGAPRVAASRDLPLRDGRVGDAPSRPARVGRPRGAFLAGTVALVLCAGSPYLGWRTGDAFTMYSGLDTLPAGWNHVLLPPAVRLRD